jgi:hypothetical protein
MPDIAGADACIMIGLVFQRALKQRKVLPGISSCRRVRAYAGSLCECQRRLRTLQLFYRPAYTSRSGRENLGNNVPRQFYCYKSSAMSTAFGSGVTSRRTPLHPWRYRPECHPSCSWLPSPSLLHQLQMEVFLTVGARNSRTQRRARK